MFRTVEVFAQGLNFPSAIAFAGTTDQFKVFVLESGSALGGRCDDNANPVFGGQFSATNPLTSNILVFD